MKGRYFLYILGIVSLVWIGFVSVDLLDKKNQLSALHIFGEKDGRVLVINRPLECKIDQLSFKPPIELLGLVEKMESVFDQVKMLIISEAQNHLYIEGKIKWSKSVVRNFFGKTKISIRDLTRNSFRCGQFEVRYNHAVLYFTKSNVQRSSSSKSWLLFDRKSSASIIDFGPRKYSISDVYVKDNGCLQFITRPNSKLEGNQVDDQNLFATALPNDLANYHFYEKKYYSGLDPVYRKGPLFSWGENGFVEFEFQGEKVLMSDFIAGQEPVLTLNDLVGNLDPTASKKDGFYKNIQLTEQFPVDRSLGFYIKTMDNFVVMSSSKSVCEQVVADYRLGNTLAVRQEKIELFFASLPKNVSERSISPESTFSRTVYQDKLLETQWVNSCKERSRDFNRVSKESSTRKKEPLSFFVGGKIKDFTVLEGKGEVIAVTNDGLVSRFSGGKPSWVKELGSEVVDGIHCVDVGADGGRHFLITTKKKIHLFDNRGREMAGFPIVLNSSPNCAATFFRWKGNRFCTYVNERNELVVFDASGKMISSFKTGLSKITQRVQVWVSQKIVLAAVEGDNQCLLYNLEKKREHRRFSIDDHAHLLKYGNELFHFSVQDKMLFLMDQKGVKKSLGFESSGQIFDVRMVQDQPLILLKSGNKLQVVDFQGKLIGGSSLPNNEIEDICIAMDSKGIYSLAVVDGLSNNVYCYQLNERTIGRDSLEGSTKVSLHWYEENKCLITTVVDGYLVQYFK
jgi:hypothetical protein